MPSPPSTSVPAMSRPEPTPAAVMASPDRTGFDPEIARWFAAGRFADVRAKLAQVGDDTLFARIIAADMDSRLLISDPADVAALRDEVTALDDDGGLRWWVEAMIAERMLCE